MASADAGPSVSLRSIIGVSGVSFIGLLSLRGRAAIRYTARSNAMRWLIILSILPLPILAGCDFFDECSSNTEVVMFSGFGPNIDDPVELAVGSTYIYELTDAVYLADQEGGGRATCPQRNKRLPEIDSLVVVNASVATAEILSESTLQIRALQPGSTRVTVYMNATVTGETGSLTYHPTVSTTTIVE